jgi:hypothetical protein
MVSVGLSGEWGNALFGRSGEPCSVQLGKAADRRTFGTAIRSVKNQRGQRQWGF